MLGSTANYKYISNYKNMWKQKIEIKTQTSLVLIKVTHFQNDQFL